MFKCLEFLVRKPGISREEFRDYYETRHRPLAFQTWPQLVKHVRNYPDESPAIKPLGVPGVGQIWDCVSELYFADRQGYEALAEFMTDPERSKEMWDDALRFLDVDKCGRLLVDEVIADRSQP